MEKLKSDGIWELKVVLIGGGGAEGTKSEDWGELWNGTKSEVTDGMESVLTEVCRLVPVSDDHALEGGSVETVLMGELYGEQLSGESDPPLLLKFR